MSLYLALLACRRSPPDENTATPDPTESTAPAPDTNSTETGTTAHHPLGCDLAHVELDVTNEPPLLDAASYTTRIVGAANSWTGASSAVIRNPAGDGGELAVGAVGDKIIGTFYDHTYAPSILLAFHLPLAPGSVDFADADIALLPEREVDGEYSDAEALHLRTGDLTGDGWDDLVVVGMSWGWGHVYVLPSPLPAGGGFLPVVASTGVKSVIDHFYLASVYDWNADGMDDLGLGYSGGGLAGQPPGGAMVYLSPLPADITTGRDTDALFDVSALDDPLGQGSGTWSILIPDVDADGAADILVEGNAWTDIAPYDGFSALQFEGGFALFSGNQYGRHALGEERAIIYAECDPSLGFPVVVGDVTGDGVEDVALPGALAAVNGEARGALWILSRLGSVAGQVSLTEASDAVIIGHGPTSSARFAGITSLVDLDGDGYGDLAVSDTSARAVYVFLGPLSGFIDTWEADLQIVESDPAAVFFGASLSAGDVDLDGTPDLIIGDYLATYGGAEAGAVTIMSGASLLAAMN